MSDSSQHAPYFPAAKANAEVPWWGRIASLWLLMLPLCVLLYSLTLTIGPNDFWYHARAGRAIAQSGTIPRVNGFSSSPPWVSPATPFYYQSWLAEWTLFRLLQSGGLSSIIVARSACLTLAWSFLAAAGARRVQRIGQQSTSQFADAKGLDATRIARLAAGGAGWAFAMSSNNMDTRPQMFSVPLFAAVTWAVWEWPFLDARARFQIGALLAALMALWANTHGAFFTGLIVLGLFAIGETVAFGLALVARNSGEKGTSKAAWPQAAWLVLGASVVAACFNPRGVAIYAYVRRLATLQSGQKYIDEWQSPNFSLAEWNSLVFGAAPLCALIVAFLAIRKARSTTAFPTLKYFEGVLGASGVRPAEIIIALALLMMALRDKRSILWFAIFFAPLWSALMASWRPPVLFKTSPAPPRATWFVNAVLMILLCLSPLVLLPRSKAGLDWPLGFRARFAPTPQGRFPRGFSNDPALLLDRETPVEAATFLLHSPPRRRLWHDMVFGSYLMWALDGRLRVMCDPRVELYPAAFWDDYAHLISGPPDATRVLEKRGYSDVLLNSSIEKQLLARLKQSPGWKVVFQRDVAVLLRHR